jgi:hypothetical protein
MKGPPHLTSPSYEQIVINSIYAFTTYALHRDMEFDPVIFKKGKLMIEM